MALSELNIALRLDSREFERGIRRAERAAQSMSNNLRTAGNGFAIAFTAPLALIGGAAIKASGEFEQLQRAIEATMTGAGYSIEQAGQELEKLREIAKAPGLDFKEAVDASNRLQSVGLSADQARETIKQFANGVAAAGGTAQNLSGVTVQLAQMIGKGKVLSQDLKIIKENMPSVSSAMVKAFGTADAEGIQKLNISADEFVRKITEELSKTPRVVGGLSNAMVNAQAAITQAAVKLGDTLNKTFDITGTLDRFGDWVTGLADKFAALDDGTKKAIIGVGLFAAALGPALRVGGAVVSVASKMQVAMKVLSAAMVRSETATLGLGTAFSKLSLATRLTAVGAAIGVVLAAVAAYKLLSSEVSAGEEAKKAFTQATIETRKETAQEVAVLNKNIEVLKNVNASSYDRKRAIDELKAAYPDYLKGMDLEKLSISELNELQKNLNASILRGVAERKKAEAINKIYENQADLILRVQELKKGGKVTPGEAALIDTGEMIRAGGIAQAVILKHQAKIKALGEEAIKSGNAFDTAFGLNSEAYRAASSADDDYASAAERLSKITIANSASIDQNTASLKSQKKAAKESADELSTITEQPLLMNEQEAEAKRRNEIAPLPSLGNLGNTQYGVALPGVSQIQSQATGIDSIAKSLGVATSEWEKYKAASTNAISAEAEKMNEIIARIEYKKQLQEALGEGMKALGAVIGETLASSERSWSKFAEGLKAIVAKVIGEIVRLYVAHVIEKVYEKNSFLGIYAVPISIAAGAVAEGAIKGALKLAKGGLAYGPTLAMVGDNRGAASNPEVIAPLSKLESMLNRSGGGQQYLYSVIRGDDILLVSDRAVAKRNRFR